MRALGAGEKQLRVRGRRHSDGEDKDECDLLQASAEFFKLGLDRPLLLVYRSF